MRPRLLLQPFKRVRRGREERRREVKEKVRAKRRQMRCK